MRVLIQLLTPGKKQIQVQFILGLMGFEQNLAFIKVNNYSHYLNVWVIQGSVRIRIQDSESRIQNSGFRILDFGFLIPDS